MLLKIIAAVFIVNSLLSIILVSGGSVWLPIQESLAIFNCAGLAILLAHARKDEENCREIVDYLAVFIWLAAISGAVAILGRAEEIRFALSLVQAVLFILLPLTIIDRHRYIDKKRGVC